MGTLWTRTTEAPWFSTLDGELDADVAVVGAGVAGLTTAFLLQKAGRRVVVLEAGEVAGGESSHTSAHLTAVQDTRWKELLRTFGQASTRLVAQEGMRAISWIEETSGSLGIDCDFARVPGFLYTENRDELKTLEQERDAAAKVGLQVSLHDRAPLPFETRGALRFANQAVFHPLKWLRGLASEIGRSGGRIFERSRVESLHDGAPCVVRTARGSVRALDVVIATDSPVHNLVTLHAKLSPYRTYLVTLPVDEPLVGLFWENADPYHYMRSWQGPEGAVVLVGGEDHSVGAPLDTRASFDRLGAWAQARFGGRVDGQWSGQVNEPADGLPFVGRSPLARHLYVATGFSGTGLVNGTLAGMILAGHLQGRESALARLLSAGRVKPLAQAKEAIAHNLQTARWMVGDRLKPPGDARSVDEVPAGEGRLVRVGNERLAVYRSDEGRLHALSPVCTHMGCYVHWNTGERTWDCPCHGSRFDTSGQVLHGPAMRALEQKELPQEEEAPRPPPDDEHAPA